MAIKRVTIDYDDLPDNTAYTTAPSSLIGPQGILPVEREQTDIPSKQADYSLSEDEILKQASLSKNETIGRTPSDLVYVYFNKPQFMATLITFFCFLIYAAKLNTLSDIKFPISMAITLNFLWFGIPGIIKLFRYIFR